MLWIEASTIIKKKVFVTLFLQAVNIFYKNIIFFLKKGLTKTEWSFARLYFRYKFKVNKKLYRVFTPPSLQNEVLYVM